MTEPLDTSPDRSRMGRLFHRYTPAVLLLLLCVMAFTQAVKISAHADWPYLTDALRDIGMAQTILDGRYPEDSVLRGETLWYNPLTGALVAAVSRLSGLPPHAADVRMGAYLNLLLPLAFFLLASALFGRWTALISTAFLLLGNTQVQPIWLGVTYTPWLFAPHLAQALFFFTLLLFWKACQRDHWGWHTATGVLWGLVFMTHTAPAVIFGCILLITTACRLRTHMSLQDPRFSSRRLIAYALLAILTAFVVSAPYHYSILWNYRFRVINPWPGIYLETPLLLANLQSTLWQGLNLPTALAVLGLVTLALGKRPPAVRVLILAWLAILLLFLGHSYASQGLRPRWQLPQLLPAHHFALSLNALRSMLFGCGAMALAGGLLALIRACFMRAQKKTRRTAWQEPMAALLALAALFAACGPGYPSWLEFTRPPEERLPFAQIHQDLVRCYDWTMAHCQPDDVFLSEESLALLVLEPAARKTVCPMLFYGSPYADVLKRLNDREAMFDALRAKDETRFHDLAKSRHVSFVLVQGREKSLLEQAGFSCFQPAFESGPLSIFGYTPSN